MRIAPMALFLTSLNLDPIQQKDFIEGIFNKIQPKSKWLIPTLLSSKLVPAGLEFSAVLFSGRTISQKHSLKYINPSKEIIIMNGFVMKIGLEKHKVSEKNACLLT
jgi:hypothetical protein